MAEPVVAPPQFHHPRRTLEASVSKLGDAVRAVRRSLRVRATGDDGFSVMETIVAIAIIGGVMTSAALFFTNGLKETGGQGRRQTAVTIANQAIETAQRVAPGSLLVGRTSAIVSALMATPGASTLTANDQTSSGNTDNTGTASTPAVPDTYNQVVDGVTYTVHTYINPCWLTGSATAGNCTATQTTGTTKMFRVTVDVSYPPSGGVSCFGYATGQCDYTTATLIDPSSDATFNPNISTPLVTSVNPGSVLVGSTTNVTLTGSDFKSGALVSIASGGGLAGSISSITSTSIVFSLAAGTTPGTYLLTVLNPDGGRITTGITITANPTITAISPASVTVGTTTPLTLTGTGFQSGATITVGSGGSTSGANVVSSTSATVSFTATAVGTPTITLTNPDGGTASKTLTVTNNLSTPNITSLSPSSLACSTSPTSVNISGSGFVSGFTANDGVDTVNSTTWYSSTSGQVVITPYLSTTGNRTLVLTNPDGGNTSIRLGMASCPAPNINSSGGVQTGSTSNGYPSISRSGGTVTVYGSQFLPGATVSVSAGSAGAVTYVSSSQLRFSWDPPNSTGYFSFTFTVTNPDGQSDSQAQTMRVTF